MLAGVFLCHHLNTHRSDEYIVPEASDGDVTDTACPGRIPPVEQQVSLPLFLIKTETDIQATFTSHQDRSPKAHCSSPFISCGFRICPPSSSITHLVPGRIRLASQLFARVPTNIVKIPLNCR